MLSKSIRFYGSKREQEILDALSRHREYGYDNERQMMLDAIYQMIQRSNKTLDPDDAESIHILESTHQEDSINLFDEDAFLDKLINRLKSEQMIAAKNTTLESDAIADSSITLSKETEESNLDNALDFIDSLL